MRYLLALLLVGCTATPQKTVAFEPVTRHIASKNDLLYTYRVGVDYPNGFEKAFNNANQWCGQHGMVAVERLQAQCGVYEGQPTLCTVAFKCQ
jgi:hypothetical protein